MDFENSLFQAMDMISSKRIAEAGFDKTVQATVIDCVDESIGKYKVKYQDGFWYAYTNNIDTKYIKGTNVYILIPNGNMSNEKTILGSTEKLGINYTYVESQQDRYLPIGANVIGDTQRHGLCSYETETVVLYDENSQDNTIVVDDESLTEYVKTADHLIISTFIQTALPVQQRNNGNYGLRFYIQFRDYSTQRPVIRTYTFDISQMTGNPYIYVNEIEQKAYFSIDAENFTKIVKIEMFVAGFPKQESGHNDDIFLSGISVCAAEFLPQEKRNGVALNLITRKGLIFTNSDSADAERTIEGQVRLKNKIVPSTNSDLAFYWFKQNNRITADNLYYTKYGGQGWQCLNQYVTVQPQAGTTRPAVVQFVKGSHVYTVKKSDVTSKYTKYKCVVIYGANIISKQFTIVNFEHLYDVEIQSDRGTTFANDSGEPTLTCIVKDSNGQVIENPTNRFDFVWTVVNNNNVFTTLPESDSSVPQEDQRVQGNKIYNIKVNQIVHYNIYKCSVFAKGESTLIGNASITLTNELNVELNYLLMINNGSQVFNYNEYGIAPTNLSFENPYVIPELSFTLYDKKGQEIPQNFIRSTDVTWTVPIKNTLIQLDDTYNEDSTVSEDGNYRIITGTKTLIYDIEQRYDISATENNIKLKVNYQGMTILAQTNFTFTKQGDIGTNGTEYQVRIVPNLLQGEVFNEYPTIYCTSQNAWQTNWRHKSGTSSGQWFKVELWHNGELIFNGVNSGPSTKNNKQVTVEWSILRNRYTSTSFDLTCLSADYNNINGQFTFTYHDIWGTNRQSAADIVQAKITFEGLDYYATMPVIITRRVNNAYKAVLKKNTGFRYAIYQNDGTEPNYDNHAPFEITVTNNNNDISQTCNYTWYYVNSYKNRDGNVFYNNPVYLEEGYRGQDSPLAVNQQIVYPLDNFDGRTVNNAIIVVIKIGTNTIAQMHIPVHLFFNRYSNAALNGWNGNSIELDNDGGMILAPQVGAGKKETDNSFTGLVMGRVVEDEFSNTDEVGLFGYNHGTRNIFLDAKTGKAEFGQAGKGQIRLNPGIEAVITGGNYNYNPYSGGSGMQINLTAPTIKYGSGKFEINRNGELIAENADITGTINAQHGTIGTTGSKIHIGEWTKTIGSTIIDSDSAIWYGKDDGFEDDSYGFYIGTQGISIGPYFSIDSMGDLNASNGTFTDMIINGGSIEITGGVNNEKTMFSASSYGVNIVDGSFNISKTQGTSLKTIFDVDDSGLYLQGEINATSGYIGAWQINDGEITNGYITLNDDTGISVGSVFQIDNNGKLFAEDAEIYGTIKADTGQIGPWFIDDFAISNNGESPYSDKAGPGEYNKKNHMYFGTSGISLSDVFKVSNQGKLTATGVDIQGEVKIKSGKMEILAQQKYSDVDSLPNYILFRNYVQNTVLDGVYNMYITSNWIRPSAQYTAHNMDYNVFSELDSQQLRINTKGAQQGSTLQQNWTQVFDYSGIYIVNQANQNIFVASHNEQNNARIRVGNGYGGGNARFLDTVYFAGDEKIYVDNNTTLKDYVASGGGGSSSNYATKAGNNAFTGTNTFASTTIFNGTVNIGSDTLAQYCADHATQTTNNYYDNSVTYSGFGYRGGPGSTSIDSTDVVGKGAAWFCTAENTNGTLPWTSGYFFLLCFSVSSNSCIQLAFKDKNNTGVKYRAYNSGAWGSWHDLL